jgi:hypothetical protein
MAQKAGRKPAQALPLNRFVKGELRIVKKGRRRIVQFRKTK